MANNEGAVTKVSLPMGNPANEPAILIERPPAGSYIVKEVPPGSRLKLDFNTTDVRIAALDVDLLLVFPDGGKVVLPGYTLNMLGVSGSEAIFLDKTMLAQELLANISDVRLTDESTMRLVAESSEEQKAEANGKEKEKQDETPPPSPPVPPAPPMPGTKLTGVADFTKPPEEAGDTLPRRPAEERLPASSGAPPSIQEPRATTSPASAMATSRRPSSRSCCSASPATLSRPGSAAG